MPSHHRLNEPTIVVEPQTIVSFTLPLTFRPVYCDGLEGLSRVTTNLAYEQVRLNKNTLIINAINSCFRCIALPFLYSCSSALFSSLWFFINLFINFGFFFGCFEQILCKWIQFSLLYFHFGKQTSRKYLGKKTINGAMV